jgi:hypothetical protein
MQVLFIVHALNNLFAYNVRNVRYLVAQSSYSFTDSSLTLVASVEEKLHLSFIRMEDKLHDLAAEW